MTTFELVSAFIALSAFITSCIAVLFNGVQTKKAVEAINLQQKLSASAYIVDDLIRRFYDLLKEGELHEKVIEPEWSHKYWNLLTTEFYFFQHGILPTFIVSLWMTDLANIYSGKNGKEIRKSHIDFLENNSFQYKKMLSFYEKIYNIAEKESNSNSERNRKIIEFTSSWISKNKENIQF